MNEISIIVLGVAMLLLGMSLGKVIFGGNCL